MLRLSGTGATHVGLVRENNQDSAYAGALCLLVADGVGGGAAGEVASATTAYVVSSAGTSPFEADPLVVLRAAVFSAQQQLALGIEEDELRSGMATTLTAVLGNGRTFALAHLGDSRGYLFRGGSLQRLTHDHTFVQELVDAGKLTPEAAARHPWRNVVMRTVHGDAHEHADLTPLNLRVGDRLLLATDGLTDLVPEHWLEAVLARHDDDAAVQALLDGALHAGGRDNITCTLATVVEGPEVGVEGRAYGALVEPCNVIDPTGVRSVRSA